MSVTTHASQKLEREHVGTQEINGFSFGNQIFLHRKIYIAYCVIFINHVLINFIHKKITKQKTHSIWNTKRVVYKQKYNFAAVYVCVCV